MDRQNFIDALEQPPMFHIWPLQSRRTNVCPRSPPATTVPSKSSLLRKATCPSIATSRTTIPDLRRRRTDNRIEQLAKYKSKVAPRYAPLPLGRTPRRAVSLYTLVWRPIFLVIEDRRGSSAGTSSTEVRVLLKSQASNETRYWVDTQMFVEELQKGPSRISGERLALSPSSNDPEFQCRPCQCIRAQWHTQRCFRSHVIRWRVRLPIGQPRSSTELDVAHLCRRLHICLRVASRISSKVMQILVFVSVAIRDRRHVPTSSVVSFYGRCFQVTTTTGTFPHDFLSP
ncbi:hypothetical protein OH76DRAFT_935920 [Lentinus brumalis]|uniref:Uncharacterized protein n=1 Tax=Lentinus brumalis TaxID=2498619 RepID=A0A371CZC4_9APHY|nr:hypothetical protein OH76DRAFT_935920 [Polyporus brumalis]